MILNWSSELSYIGLQPLLRSWTTSGGAATIATERGHIDYDQIRALARHGIGPQMQMFGGGAAVSGHLAAFDAAGNLVDSGSAGGGVSSARLISTTAPLTGGGDLSADRTLAVSLATTSTVGVVKPDGTSITIDGTGKISTAASAGTVPTVVQVAYSNAGGNGLTFGSAPTNGNLLVAIAFNPTSAGVGSGWTQRVNNSTGADWGLCHTKVAGASESATQTPLSGVSTTGTLVVWELHGQNASSPFVYGVSQAEQAGTSNTPILLPNLTNCIGLCAIGVVPSPTITAALNLGTQDVLDSTGSRFLAAGHTDLSKAPLVGTLAIFSSSASNKELVCLITS